MSNISITYPRGGDNSSKGLLIPDGSGLMQSSQLNGGVLRDLLLEEGSISYQLVGGITAHQGFDG